MTQTEWRERGARLVRALGELGPEDFPRIGGKAAGLVRLRALDLRVPDGVCVLAAAYRDHIDRNDLRPAIAELAAAAHPGERLAALREAIRMAPLDPHLAESMVAGLGALADGPIAVRSSASEEDLPGHSFAGQHGTYFVRGRQACLRALKDCWASLWTDRAYAYREQGGFDQDCVSMAVILQELIEARTSGVAFTVDPVTGAEHVVIEACFGLGEALVSGKVSPDRFVLSKPGLEVLSDQVASKNREIVLDAQGCVRQRDVRPGRAGQPCLDEPDARRIAQAALRAEDELGVPQDVEWSLRDGELFVLQCRPVTTRGAPPEARVLWSNANAGEVLPDVAPPMTWSLASEMVNTIFSTIFESAGVDVGGRKFLGRIGGRIYFNLNVIVAAVARVPGLGKADLTHLLGGMQGTDVRIPADWLTSDALPSVDFSLLRMLVRAPRFLLFLRAHAPRKGGPYLDRMRSEIGVLESADTEHMTEEQVAAHVDETRAQLRCAKDVISFAFVGFIGFENLTRMTKRWFGDEHDELANRLLAGLGGMDSAEAGLALWALARTASQSRAAGEALGSDARWEEVKPALESSEDGRRFIQCWDRFMAEHGHHARGELDVANPRWRDRPDYVLGMVRAYMSQIAAGAPDPLSQLEARAAERESITRDCMARLDPLRRCIFRRALESTQMGAVLRENAKSEAVRCFAVLRVALLALGERLAARGVLAQADDVFFLYEEELAPVREGRAAFGVSETIATRRASYERWKSSPPPPPVIMGGWDAQAIVWEPEAPLAREARGVMHGLAVSAGVAEGPARVVLKDDGDVQVLPGEILVAPFTDPGWTPYFIPAAGLVVDMGGMLSHGSIIAREYGIPAVVNVGSATATIRDGQMLRVDGSRGEVTLLD